METLFWMNAPRLMLSSSQGDVGAPAVMDFARPKGLCPCCHFPVARWWRWDNLWRSQGSNPPAPRSSELNCGWGHSGPCGSAGRSWESCGRWGQGGRESGPGEGSDGCSPVTGSGAVVAWWRSGCLERPGSSGRDVLATVGWRSN